MGLELTLGHGPRKRYAGDAIRSASTEAAYTR